MTKKDDTLNVTFVLDQTGSMYETKDDTIKGFNEYLKELRKEQKGKLTAFTLVLFNSANTEVRYAADKLGAVKKLTPETYIPNFATPLYDAIGKAIRAQETAIGKKGKAIVVILTDGYENASNEWTQNAIRQLIEEKQGSGWAFVFLGANQDAWLAGGAIGIYKSNISTYHSSRTAETMNVAAHATVMYAASSGEQTDNLISDEDIEKLKEKQWTNN